MSKTHKVCTRCAVDKPIEDYYEDRSARKTNRMSRCKACVLESKKATYNEEANRVRGLWTRYRLRPEEYDAMISKGCMACGSKDNPHVHHDHNCCSGKRSCGECVIGILCAGCNNSEGHLKNYDRAYSLATFMASEENIFDKESRLWS